MWGAHLAGNLPSHAWNLDQLGLDENWKQNVHAAERTKGGACADRLGSSLFEASGSAQGFEAGPDLNPSSFLTKGAYLLSL